MMVYDPGPLALLRIEGHSSDPVEVETFEEPNEPADEDDPEGDPD